MLYVFSMDTGTMLTFDINLAMKSVLELQVVLAKQYKISEDKQVLLISGGEHLDPEQRVCSYSAGTDTNPIFLFSKSTIESSCLPTTADIYGSDVEMREKVEGALNMPPSYETVVTRAQLALQFHDVGREEFRRCEQLVHDQHLQHQGWAAAVANLEDITSSFKSRTDIFRCNFEEYLLQRDAHIETLNGFPQAVELLSRLPLLPSLLPVVTSPLCEEAGGDEGEMTVLDWIAAQDSKNSLDQMADMCHKGIQQLDHEVMGALLEEVESVLENVNNPNMKEVKGLEDRLFKLEQLMFSARKLVQEQAEMSQGFVQNQNRASNVRDNSIFPDLCASHRQQLLVMLKNHQRLREAREKCAKAKDELCHNLHQRLRWIMYVEKNIYDVDGKLVIHHENLKRLKRRLEIIKHVYSAPQIYAAIVIEIYRRRDFKQQFMVWAIRLSADSERLYKDEITRRNNINQFVGQHFFRILFPGLAEEPAAFATECPEPFDLDLPMVTVQDIENLKEKVPELSACLSVPEEFDITQHVGSVTSSKGDPAGSPSVGLEQSTSDIEVINHPDNGSPSMPRPRLVVPNDVTNDESKSRRFVQSAASSKDSPIEMVTMAEITDMENTVTNDSTDNDVYHDVTDGKNGDDAPSSDVVPHMRTSSDQTVVKSSTSTGSSGSKREVSLGSDSLAGNSGDFHTGVFYIDESMPSSMAESPPLKMKKLDELQQALDDRDARIHGMEDELNACKCKLGLVEEKLKLLHDLTERDTLKLKCEFLTTEKQIQKDKDEFSAYLNEVCTEISTLIGKAGEAESAEREKTINVLRIEYETKIIALQTELAEEVAKSDQLRSETGELNKIFQDLNVQFESYKTESEANLQECKNACEAEIDDVNRKLTLSHEVDLDRAKDELRSQMADMEGELTQLRDGVSEKQSLINKLQKQIEYVTESLSEKFQGEKAEIVKILEEQYHSKQAADLLRLEERAASTLVETVERLNREHEAQRMKERDELCARLLEEKQTEIATIKTVMETLNNEKLEQIQLRSKMEKQQALDEACASIGNAREMEVLKLRSELETVKSDKQKMVQSMVETTNQRIPLEEHNQIISDLTSQLEKQHSEALNQALNDLRREHDEEVNEMKDNHEQDRIDSLKSMKTNMAAEKQVAFNEALKKVVQEKDRQIEELRRREQCLLDQLRLMESINGPDLMSQSQNVMTLSVVPIRESVTDSDPSDLPTRVTELEAKLRSKHEETSRLQSKLMELSMTHSTRTLMQHDKVSITTCNLGDLVLLCLDERHDHYVVFTVGNTLHFLHSDCLETLSLKSAGGETKKSWVLAEVTDKEYCQAKKPTNRFKVPVGTKFYRVKARPWNRDPTNNDTSSLLNKVT